MLYCLLKSLTLTSTPCSPWGSSTFVPRVVWAGIGVAARLCTEGIPHPPRVPLQFDRVAILDGHSCVARHAKRSTQARAKGERVTIGQSGDLEGEVE